MSTYVATVRWQLGADEQFIDNAYSRGHEWEFDGGVIVPASSSPSIVPEHSVAENVDPEEAFVAALSSCHMLFFLSLAARRRVVVVDYVDDAFGVRAAGDEGRMMMQEVTLRPLVSWAGREPRADQLTKMHLWAHEQCFIANSVKTLVKTEIRTA